MSVPFVVYDAKGAVVMTGFCQEEDVPTQVVPDGGGVMQTENQIHPAQMQNWKVEAGALVSIGS